MHRHPFYQVDEKGELDMISEKTGRTEEGGGCLFDMNESTPDTREQEPRFLWDHMDAVTEQ